MISLQSLEKEFGDKFDSSDQTIRRYSYSPYLVSPVINKLWNKVLGIIYAEDEDDVKHAISLVSSLGISIVAFGSGTSTIGQIVPLKPSIMIDLKKMNGILQADKEGIVVKPGTTVLDILKTLRKKGLDLMVYPSSFYMSTIGGYIAGGDVGIGSFQYGYYFDAGIKYFKLIGSVKEKTISNSDVFGVAQAAGTTGIVTEIGLPVSEKNDWKDYLLRFENLMDLVKLLSEFDKNTVRRITIEDDITLRKIAGNRIEKIGKWNLMVSSSKKVSGEEVDLRFLDELAFAAIYVTMSKLSNLKEYFYEVRLLTTEEFYYVVTELKGILGNNVFIHGDVMTINGKIIIYTVFISERDNFKKIDEVMTKHGIPFEIHSIEINDRVDSEFRLEIMKKLKTEMDPRDIINPGKLRL
ncbi:FAD-binding oxidoreductase [Candidatus Acidianus copahuensis]|nr:FAD-binding oxidoreductase [Candidatus Acidianus copahuensis]